MTRTSRLPKDWRQQLRQLDAEERKTEGAKQFRALVKEAEAIPLRNRTQYPMYVEVRTVHMMRGMAEIEGVTIQQFIREILEEGIERRVKRCAVKKSG